VLVFSTGISAAAAANGAQRYWVGGMAAVVVSAGAGPRAVRRYALPLIEESREDLKGTLDYASGAGIKRIHFRQSVAVSGARSRSMGAEQGI